jgi:hypothetical protein
VAGQDIHTECVAAIEQCLKDGARGVGDGEEFSGFGSRLSSTPIDANQRMVAGTSKAARMLRMMFCEPLKSLGNLVVSDVAAAAAGDEDFCAQCFCAVEDDDAECRRGRFGGKDRRGQSGRPAADDGEIRPSTQVD